LHLKVLTEPINTNLAVMVQSMTDTFSAIGVVVNKPSCERLALPQLDDLDVGAPTIEGPITPEQDLLFGNRNNASPNQICAYFVRSCFPPWSGCASRMRTPQFPNGRPSVVVASVGSRWTLAHECGHILGLSHVVVDDRLMIDRTWRIQKQPPDLVPAEVTTMKASRFMQ